MRVGISLYSLRARVWPSVLVVLPAAAVLATIFPDQLAGVEWLGPLAISAGLLYVVSHVTRDQGGRVEPALFSQWGGAPTTNMLRHRGPLSETTRRRYHDALETLVPGVRIPSAAAENADPHAADEVYESCTLFLLEATRDEKVFGLVAEENASYGFRRNTYGLRRLGLAISALCVAVITMLLWQGRVADGSIPLPVTMAFCIGMLLFWAIYVTPAWVKRAGDAYAERLLGTCDLLARTRPPS